MKFGGLETLTWAVARPLYKTEVKHPSHGGNLESLSSISATNLSVISSLL